MTFLAGVPAVSVEVEEGVMVRLDPDTQEVLGVTITGFSHLPDREGISVDKLQGSLRMTPQAAIA